jgi:hypothetical protein
VAVEVRDVAEGLWSWRQPHPAWQEGADWEPHGEPVHDRDAFVAALDREPWSDWSGA